MYPSFTYALRHEGISATPAHAIDLIEGIQAGLAPTLGDLFLLAKATYVKKPKEEKAFQRSFFSYFLDIPTHKTISLEESIRTSNTFQLWQQHTPISEDEKQENPIQLFIMDVFGDYHISKRSLIGKEKDDLLSQIQYQKNQKDQDLQDKMSLDQLAAEFLERMNKEKKQPHYNKDFQPALNPESTLHSSLLDTGGYTVAKDHTAEEIDFQNISTQDLESRLRDLLKSQHEKHEGGNTWIGQKGNGAFGNNGFSRYGIRVGGTSKLGTARRVLNGTRQKYGTGREVKGQEAGDMQEVLQELKLLSNEAGDSPRTLLNIDRTVYLAGKRGYVQIQYDRKEVDKMHVALFIDNGGKSMHRHVPIVEKLFAKMSAQLQSLDSYYFHNCIYDTVFTDPNRTREIPLDVITSSPKETRVIIVGDASMHPHYDLKTQTLTRVKEAFPYCVWLNPLQEEQWQHTSSIRIIQSIFKMYELTTPGLKQAVQYLTQNKSKK